MRLRVREVEERHWKRERRGWKKREGVGKGESRKEGEG